MADQYEYSSTPPEVEAIKLSCVVDPKTGRFQQSVVDAVSFRQLCLNTVPPVERKNVFVGSGASIEQSIKDMTADCTVTPSQKAIYCNLIQDPIDMGFYMSVALNCGFQYNTTTKVYETDPRRALCWGKLDYKVPVDIPLEESKDGTCGPDHNNTRCPTGECCSSDGKCGCTYEACILKYSDPHFSGKDTKLCKYN
jgi:hypothetical protein